ncbi:MAG: SPOR domain-containing protein, partial [Bacteroidota bacterium]
DEIISSGGFQISSKLNRTSQDTRPIPMNVKAPSGLIYRVQVGAYRKPLQSNFYSQFTPVSGELQKNGLIVYMVGYFNNAINAVDARKQIQSMGFSDAFIVAYCDGRKLTLGEARQLEARGECIPQGNNEFLVEISKNTQEARKVEDSKSSNLNSAKIDTKSLFFTVQIGVYNKPINTKEKFQDLPDITFSVNQKKQIRYATGKFNDLNDAKIRKNEAVIAGVSDAFVVAYFQGERITVDQANELLAKKQDPLFTEAKQNDPQINQSTKFVENEIKLFNDKKEEIKIEKIKYEVVSIFEEFPKEKLTYFNNYGLFQYNKVSGKLISTEFSRNLDLPDELKLSGLVKEVKVNETEERKSKIKSNIINGDLMDVLLRTNWLNSIENLNEISLILSSNLLINENHTNFLKSTFNLEIENYDKK